MNIHLRKFYSTGYAAQEALKRALMSDDAIMPENYERYTGKVSLPEVNVFKNKISRYTFASQIYKVCLAPILP